MCDIESRVHGNEANYVSNAARTMGRVLIVSIY